MSEFDIFKLVRSKPDRHKNVRTNEASHSRPNMDDLVTGKEEKKYKNRKRKNEIDALDREITENKRERKFKNNIKKLHMGELDKHSQKNQNKVLKREYIVCYEQIESYERTLDELDNALKEKNVDFHIIKKENTRIKDLVREIVVLLPANSDIIHKIETNVWEFDDVQDSIIKHFKRLVDKIDNIDDIIQKETTAIEKEKKAFQKKFIQLETENKKFKQYTEELKSFYEKQIATLKQKAVSAAPSKEDIQKQVNEHVTNIKKTYDEKMDEMKKNHEKKHQDYQSKIDTLESELEKTKKERQKQPNKTNQNNAQKPEKQKNKKDAHTKSVEEKNQIEHPNKQSTPKANKFDDSNFDFPTNKNDNPPEEEKIIHETGELDDDLDIDIEMDIDDIDMPSLDDFDPEEPELPEMDEPTMPEMDNEPDIPSFEDSEPDFDDDDDDDDDDDSGLSLFDPEPYLERLSDNHKKLIKIIGETGISRNKELKNALDDNDDLKNLFKTPADVSAAVKSLRDAGLLDDQLVKLGAKGYQFQVYELNEPIGKGIYKQLTGKKPAVPDCRKIVDQHASLEHGYLIRESHLAFEELGYKTYTNRKDLRFDLDGGKRKDFDLIIEKDGEKCYIEVERGTHTKDDFFKAMDKIYAVMKAMDKKTAQFHFVCPNEKIMFGETKTTFFKWVKDKYDGIQNVNGDVAAYFTTLERIKKKQKTIWDPYEFK